MKSKYHMSVDDVSDDKNWRTRVKNEMGSAD